MKVVLINPPTINSMKTNESFFSMSAVNFFPPVNLMYLSTMVKNAGKHKVKIIDADIEHKDYETIAKEVQEEKAELVGITAYTMAFYDCLETMKAIKRKTPSTIICVGGPLTKYFAKDAIESHNEIDYIFIGDAEQSFPELINTIEQHKDINNVKGIIHRQGTQIITTSLPQTITNLDALPFPDLESISYMKYHSAIGNSTPIAIIIGSRGCPYQCKFCQSPNTGYRLRSVNSMLDEIKHYIDNGISEFMFYDDTFNITANRVIEFSQGVLARGYKIKWGFRGRIDTVSDAMFKLAKKSGLILMSYGVEDASDEGLHAINRNQKLEQVFFGNNLAKKYKIPTSINFIIGLPTQKTKEDVERIIKLAKQLKPTYCQFSTYIPHAGTKFFEYGVKQGIIPPNYWMDYVKSPKKETYIPFWEEHLTQDELTEMVKKAHKEFYFSITYIMRTILNIKSTKDLYTKICAGLNLFKLFILPKKTKKTTQSIS